MVTWVARGRAGHLLVRVWMTGAMVQLEQRRSHTRALPGT